MTTTAPMSGWVVRGRNIEADTPEGTYLVAQTGSHDNDVAHLIAAAPTMLAALKAAKAVIEWDDDHPSNFVRPYKLICDAIDHAEGR